MNDNIECPLRASGHELKEKKRKCWSPPCKRSAWFEDWGGWHWCWKHAIRAVQQRETYANKWYEFKKLKIRYPF